MFKKYPKEYSLQSNKRRIHVLILNKINKMNIKFNSINILHLIYFIQLIFSNSRYEIKNFILLNITIMETFSFGIVFQNEYIFVNQTEILLSLEFITLHH